MKDFAAMIIGVVAGFLFYGLAYEAISYLIDSGEEREYINLTEPNN